MLALVPASLTHAQDTDDKSNKPSDPAAEKKVVIKVGGEQVTQAEFENGIGNFEGEKEDTPKERRKLGDDYASVLMLSQQAMAEHLDSTPDVSHQLAMQRLQILSNAEFDKLMDNAKPSAQDINKYYSDHASDYDQVSVRRLFIWKRHGSKPGPGLTEQEARSRADAILKASAAGSGADKLAEPFKTSKDGLLDVEPSIFPRGELPPQMEKVAYALKPGEWGEAGNTADRITLLQLVKRERRDVQTVSSLIEQRLQAQNMQAAIDKMKKNAGIWMDQEYFGTEASTPGDEMRGPSPPPQVQKSAKPKQEKSNAQDH
jgi:peptidyl-prolyl cis-trans isomerase C